MAFPGTSRQTAEKLADNTLIYYEVRRHPIDASFKSQSLINNFVTDQSLYLCVQG